MQKISITIDVSKITKSRIKENSYQNNAGESVSEKNAQFEIVPLREYKVIKKGDGWEMRKTHFVTESPTKEEKANKVKMPIIGSGIMFVNDGDTPLDAETAQKIKDIRNGKNDVPDISDAIPF